MLDNVLTYLMGVGLEGMLVGGLFWVITYIVLESTSLSGALRAGLVSEAVGNIPYLFGIPAISPPSLAMTLLGIVVFVRMIQKVGELTLMRASVGTTMTYFALIAIVSCGTGVVA